MKKKSKTRTESRKNKKEKKKRKRRRLVREGKIIVSDQEKAKLGTSYFGYHRCEDFEKEYQAVIKEKRRHGLK